MMTVGKMHPTLLNDVYIRIACKSLKAVVYGNCVASWDDVQKNDCAKEFKQFKDCYSKLLKKTKK